MFNTFSAFGDVKHKGRWIPFDEWQERRRYEKAAQARFERALRFSVCIAGALAFAWIIVPGLWNIWRGM